MPLCKIDLQVIERERRGDYLGKTVQVVPHVTDTILEWVEGAAAVPIDGTGRQPDVCIVEVRHNICEVFEENLYLFVA